MTELSPDYVPIPTPFLFARHGVTAWSERTWVMGQHDVPLSPEGERQAGLLAESLAGAGVGRIYASPLARTWLTAEIVAGRLGLTTVPIPGLMERHWGEFEGRPRAERPRGAEPATGESGAAFRTRTVEALKSIPAHLNTLPLIVAHNGTWGVIADVLSLPRDGDQLVYARAIRVSAVSGGWTSGIIGIGATLS